MINYAPYKNNTKLPINKVYAFTSDHYKMAKPPTAGPLEVNAQLFIDCSHPSIKHIFTKSFNKEIIRFLTPLLGESAN